MTQDTLPGLALADPPAIKPGTILTFPDATAWHALRRRDVTASTIAGHFGFSAWSSVYADYCLKTGLVEPDTSDSPLMRAGRHLEAGIAAMAAEQEGWDQMMDGAAFAAWVGLGLGSQGVYFRDPEARIGATPDRILVMPDGTMRPLEIKNVSWFAYRDEWEGGQAPVKYWLQGQIQAGLGLAAGLPMGGPIIGALVAGNDLQILSYDHDPDAYARCRDAAAEFWAMVEAKREPTPDLTRSVDRETIRRRWRESQAATLDLSGSDEALQVAQSLHEARRRKAAAEKEIDVLSAHLLNMVKDAEKAILPGGWTVTAKSSARKGYEVKPSIVRALKVAEPAAAPAMGAAA